MSQQEFREQFAIATALVASWPAWKQNILENSSKPTVSVPRIPVDNQRVCAESENRQKPEK